MSDNYNENTDGILPGVKPVLERLTSSPEQVDSVLIRKGKRGADIATITDACKKNKIRFTFVQDQSLDKLFDGNHQGVIAKIFEAGFKSEDEVLEEALEAELPLVVVLDQIQDPGNAGTLARTIYGIGAGGMIVPKHNASFLGAAAAKASAGALGKLAVAKATNLSRTLELAKKMGYFVYGAEYKEGAENLYKAKLHTPAVLVLGNEEKGIRPNVAKRLDVSLFIPMAHGFDSLNVAQAGAMMLSQFIAANCD
ncbi:23S rRNA (guanosine(2251)-2'-O)-methyltransferase RlmB [Halodesulfovibrio spirochaetisodalis]|uniref:RNA methyltransferase n=1 Tax=Halodesulfovibrio spirochaetisodalis TaxID=1560234 RepID=A0A1B7X902_9BACT|nr:23S rRNA (guanosine(2251)-2'-O)-methyltransferase RlmB [Halodesulfovibrio spirochaetisodalis]OBQ45828.1 RNA methyltransferase [Halodesulfovibrio spirochaetisodalis]